ncbi:MAG: hypothetical protein H6721_24875 [Sandaracinus sp.]|nr:hypothetical protein [Sandaracinus sp.]
MASPVLAGAIPRAGIVEKLTAIEARCTTGVLRWQGTTTGEVALVRGQIAADQTEREDGEDPVELLLAERTGTFEVFQILPPLPVSKGKDGMRRGSLEVHVAADLMRYCENAGLTGILAIESDGKRAEIGYDCGELGDIRLDGLDELHEVFGWEDGSFEIVALTIAPNLAEDLEDAITTEMVRPDLVVEEPKADSTGKMLLRVVEMTLAEIVKEREERRPVTKSSPAVVPLVPPKKHPTLPPPTPPAKPRREPTVRVFYLKGDAEAPKDEGVRHVSSSVELESDLPDAVSERRSEPAPAPESDLPPAQRSEGPKTQAASKPDARPQAPSARESSPSTSAESTLDEARASRRTSRPGDETVKTKKERPVTTPSASATPAPSATPAKKPLPTAVWALISLALVIGALLLLSAMPAIE